MGPIGPVMTPMKTGCPESRLHVHGRTGMFEWVYQLPVIMMALLVFSVTGIVTFGIHAVVMALAARDRAGVFRGFSPGMLSPLGTIFGILVGFLAVQVWNDAQQAEDAVNREASALRSVVIMASSFPG